MTPARAAMLAALAWPGLAAAQEIQLTGPLTGATVREPLSNDTFRLDGGALLPFVAVVPTEAPSLLGGGGLRVAVSTQMLRRLWLEGGLFGAFAASDAHQLLMVGLDAEVRIHPIRHSISHGLGIAGGYWSAADSPFFESSPFVGPLVSPVGTWIGNTHLEVRVLCLFGGARVDGVTALRLGLVAPMVTLTYGGSLDTAAPYDGGRSSQ